MSKHGAKELVVALTEAPPTVNPHESNSLHSHAVLWSVYEPLFDIGDDGGLIPRLATHWERDGLAYTFHLREAYFYPGKHRFGPQDVRDSLTRATSGNGFRARILKGLVGGVKLGGQDVTITLNYPKLELLFLALMTRPHSDDRAPLIGTGPFYFDTTDDRRDTFVLKKHPDRPQLAQLDRLRFEVVPSSDIKGRLTAGEVDLVRDVDLEDLPEILDHADLVTRRVRPFGIHYLGFNLKNRLFQDEKVRRAVQRAIDFEKIESETGLEPARGVIPPDVDGYDRTAYREARDPAPAPDTLSKCGTITLLYNENSYNGRELAARIKEDLTSAGMAITLDAKPSSRELLKAVAAQGPNDPNLCIYNWYSILPEAEIFLRPLFEKGMPDNLTGYDKAETELEKLRDPGLSPSQRIEAYRRAQKKIVGDRPVIPLGYTRIRFTAHHRKVTGLDFNVQSFPVDRFLNVDVKVR